MRLEKINRELMKELDEHKGIVKGMEKAPEKKTIYNTAYVHPKLINLPVNNVPALTHEYVIEKYPNYAIHLSISDTKSLSISSVISSSEFILES